MEHLGVSPAKKFAEIVPPMFRGRPAAAWCQTCFVSRIFRYGAFCVPQQKEFSVFSFLFFGLRFRAKENRYRQHIANGAGKPAQVRQLTPKPKVFSKIFGIPPEGETRLLPPEPGMPPLYVRLSRAAIFVPSALGKRGSAGFQPVLTNFIPSAPGKQGEFGGNGA